MDACDIRFGLWDALQCYRQGAQANHEAAQRVLDFIEAYPDCFERAQARGHITASALLLHPSEESCLLTLHKKLGRWLQPGGHADGDPDALRVAVREAEEESGIVGIEVLDEAIFDVDVHLIPARPHLGEPEHHHFDIRYLLRAPHDRMVCSDESEQLAWMSWEEIRQRQELFDEAFLRLRRLYLARAHAVLPPE